MIYEINHIWTAERWSLQWTLIIQLCKEAWKKNSGLQRGLNPWPCDTSVLSYEATDVGSRSIVGSFMNEPSPNVSGFIAQLVEHCTSIARSRVQTLLKPWIFFSGFFTQLHKLCSLRRSFLHFHDLILLHFWSVSWKMIPYSSPKLSDLYTLSQSKLLENHTLHSGTWQYPSPRGHFNNLWSNHHQSQENCVSLVEGIKFW